ncbi:MAG TPA: hypothetical protein VGV92_09280 [Gammaproteobacteria bacterium]|nr:hypothetical protein [Gammaproteobacteria bacterium]
MDVNVNKYLWQFFRYYLVGYLIGMALILTADFLLHLKMQDMILVIILATIVPNSIAMNFIKAERRYFNDAELKVMIKKSSLIAFVISIIPSVIYMGYCIVIKYVLTPQEITAMLASVHIPESAMMNQFLQLKTRYLIGILAASILLYYAIIRFIVGSSFKRIGKRFYKSMPGIKP